MASQDKRVRQDRGRADLRTGRARTDERVKFDQRQNDRQKATIDRMVKEQVAETTVGMRAQLKGLFHAEAMRTYVKTLKEAVPKWTPESRGEVANSGGAGIPSTTFGNSVSTMDQVGDSEDVDQMPVGQLNLMIHDGDIDGALEVLQKSSALAFSADKDGMSPMHRAADDGNLEVIKTLVALLGDDAFLAKSRVNMVNSDGSTPLDFAIRKENEDVVRLLLEAGADVGNAALPEACPPPPQSGAVFKEDDSYDFEDDDTAMCGECALSDVRAARIHGKRIFELEGENEHMAKKLRRAEADNQHLAGKLQQLEVAKADLEASNTRRVDVLKEQLRWLVQNAEQKQAAADLKLKATVEQARKKIAAKDRTIALLQESGIV